MTIALGSAQASELLSRARTLLRVARPGLQYPPGKPLDALFEALWSTADAGGGLELDPRSGLPTLSELTRVRADRLIAPEFLRDHSGRLTDRAAYFRWLATVEIPAAAHTEAKLVARLPKEGARLRVVHDALDPANGCWVRLTAQLTQTRNVLVRFEREDLCVPQAALEDALERCAGADAELGFLLLANLEGVTVEEVIRGQLGPLHGGHLAAPAPLEAVLQEVEPASRTVLHLVVERAATDVAEDLCRDPLSTLYRDALPPGARAAAEAKREQLGYRVSKERRLICTPALETPLRRWSAALPKPIVVRSR